MTENPWVVNVVVSIAGGDSWVGIHMAPAAFTVDELPFQSQVAILGWGYDDIMDDSSDTGRFQSQVAILGWGYLSRPGRCTDSL